MKDKERDTIFVVKDVICKDCSDLHNNFGTFSCMAGEALRLNRKKCRNFDDVTIGKEKKNELK